MGSKETRRSVFGTVLSLVAVAATGGLIAPALAPWFAGAAIVYGGLSAAYSAKQARRAQKEAENAALEDKKQMFRGGIPPLRYIYGRQWLSGQVVFVREARSKADPNMWVVVALPVAHEITGIDSIWFGDQEITPLDAVGMPASASSPFNKFFTNSHTVRGTIPAGNIVTVGGNSVDAGETVAVIPSSIVCAVTVPKPAGMQVGDDTSHEEDLVFSPPIFGPMHGEQFAQTQPPGPITSDYVNRGIQQAWAQAGNLSQAGYKPLEPAYLVSGTRNQIFIPGTPGQHQYNLTYSYTFGRNYLQVWRYLGTQTQVAFADLINATRDAPAGQPRWTINSRLTGIPYLILKLRVDPDVFPRDLENISCIIRGKKVLDTRTGVTAYSENSMLCIRDYAIEQCGVKPTEIDVNKFNFYVNACDDPIPLNFGSTNIHRNYTNSNPHDYRYTIDVSLDTSIDPIKNLEVMLTSCDGTAVFSGSSCDLRCGVYDEPTLAISDTDFASVPEITIAPPRTEVFNGVKATFVNKEKGFWPEEDTPEYLSQYYLTKDRNIRSVREISLPGTSRMQMAQRISKQMLHRSRSPLMVSATLKVMGVMLSAEQTIYMTLTATGMTKVMRIKRVKQRAPHLVDVDMQEEGPGHYAWNYQEGVWADPAPNTNLASVRNVPLIAGLGAETHGQVAVFGQGHTLTGRCRVFWNQVQDMFVLATGYVEVRHKRSIDRDWNYSPKLPPDETQYHFQIRRGDVLSIQARCANSMVKGQWGQGIVKIADDTPTEFLTGNLLDNAAMLWKTAGAGGAILDDWDHAIEAVSPNPPYGPLAAHYLTLTGTQFTQTGFWRMRFKTQLWHRRFIIVTPGQRMIVFSTGMTYNSTLSMTVFYYDKDQFLIPPLVNESQPRITISSSTAVVPATVPLPDPAVEGKLLAIFAIVPSRAKFARLSFGVTQENTSNNVSLGWVGRPYFGRASPGQVQIPPWQA